MTGPREIPGRVKEVSSPSNPIIKSLKGLALRKNRQRENMFLAEGLKLAGDALDAGWKVKLLIRGRSESFSDETRQRVDDVSLKTRNQGGDVLIVPEKIMSAIARRDNPQMVASCVEPRLINPSDIKPQANDLWIALDRVRDPGNLGTIIRTADALGAKGVILIGDTVDPFSLEAVRATMGSLFHVPLARMDEAEFIAFANKWRDESGGSMTGTHLAGAVDHRKVDYSGKPQLLVMGNEQKGLTESIASACDHLVKIAMEGQADSLNLAVSTGIMLFEMRRHAL